MASRFWVGGTGTWDGSTTTNWSASSGGAGGASVPGTADDVVFDTNSNVAGSGASYTCTRTATTAVSSITANNPSAGTLTFAGTANVTINASGSPPSGVVLGVGATVSFTYSGTITVSGAGTITTNNASVAAQFSLTANVTLGSAFKTTAPVFHSAGTLNLAGFDLTCDSFSDSNSVTANAITSGAGHFIITGSGNAGLVNLRGSGLTLNDRPTFRLTSTTSTGTRGCLTDAASITASTAPDMTIEAGSDTIRLFGSFRKIDYTGSTAGLQNDSRTVYGNLTLTSGMTTPAAGTGTTTFAATSGTQTITTAGKTLDFPLAVNAPGAIVSFADALTQGSTRAFTFTAGTLTLKNGTTSVVGVFATSGTASKTLNSASAGSQATISQATGTVTVTHLSLQDSVATGGAVWDASGATNTNNGNNSGWLLVSSSVGTITGAATVSGVGLWQQQGVGTIIGAATVSGTGVAVFPSVGTITGAATVSGTGVAVFPSVGTIAGASVATGIGFQAQSGVGSITAGATVSGVGLWQQQGVGSSTSAANTSGVGRAVFPSPGTIVGAATVSGVAHPLVPGVGTITGAASVLGAGQEVYPSVGSSAGAATVNAIGRAVYPAAGSSISIANASGVGRAVYPAAGSSIGSAVASGVAQKEQTGVGVIIGAATVGGVGIWVWPGVGTIHGAAIVFANSAWTFPSVGLSAGASIVFGTGQDGHTVPAERSFRVPVQDRSIAVSD